MCVCAYFACFKVLPDVVEVYEPVLSLVNSDIVSCSVVVMVMIPNGAHHKWYLTSGAADDPSLGDLWRST